MLSEKGVINECLLVNYMFENEEDGAVLVVCHSGENDIPYIRTLYKEDATLLYSKLLKVLMEEIEV